MFEVFKVFGDIDDEVVIPSVRYIIGRRFGFMRFFDVNNDRVLVTKLDKIFLGKHKLFINLPRF